MLINEIKVEFRNGRWRTVFRWWRLTPRGYQLVSELVA